MLADQSEQTCVLEMEGGLKDRVFQTVGEYSAASLDKIRTLICYLSAMASSSNPK